MVRFYFGCLLFGMLVWVHGDKQIILRYTALTQGIQIGVL